MVIAKEGKDANLRQHDNQSLLIFISSILSIPECHPELVSGSFSKLNRRSRRERC